MTKNELFKTLSLHSWEIKGSDSAEKIKHKVKIYCDIEPNTGKLESRLHYHGNGIKFNVPLSSVNIVNCRLKAEWMNNKVEVWI